MGTYGYCDSCQHSEHKGNDYVCKRAGSITTVSGKCKQYLPNMTNFEHIKNMGVEEMAHFVVETPPFCEHFMGGECIYGWQDCPENKCVLHAKEWLERKVSEDDKA